MTLQRKYDFDQVMTFGAVEYRFYGQRPRPDGWHVMHLEVRVPGQPVESASFEGSRFHDPNEPNPRRTLEESAVYVAERVRSALSSTNVLPAGSRWATPSEIRGRLTV